MLPLSMFEKSGMETEVGRNKTVNGSVSRTPDSTTLSDKSRLILAGRMVGSPKIVLTETSLPRAILILVLCPYYEWEVIFHHYWESSGGFSIAVVCDDARQNDWAELVFCVSDAFDGFRALFHDG